MFLIVIVGTLLVNGCSKEVDTSECDDLPIPGRTMICIAAIAIEENEPSLCEQLSNQDEALRDNCYVYVGGELRDYDICENILVVKEDDADNYAKEHNYDTCMSSVAQHLNDVDECQRRDMPDVCMLVIAGATKDSSLCDLMSGEFFSREQCLTQVEICENNQDGCEIPSFFKLYGEILP